jgi:hypothetical protein
MEKNHMSERSTLTRRAWLASLGRTLTAGLVLTAVRSDDALATTAAKLTVYKDPSCGCCTKWVAHLRANGFTPDVRDRDDMGALKDTLGVPAALRSCHTAVAGKYVVEGHVPASDIKRLLSSRPNDVIGIAVPDMPAGSPGMEMGGRSDLFDVIAFSATGTTRIFGRH